MVVDSIYIYIEYRLTQTELSMSFGDELGPYRIRFSRLQGVWLEAPPWQAEAQRPQPKANTLTGS